MTTAQPTCPKCHVHMDQGFLTDFNQHGVQVSVWVEGPPEKSFWTGLKVPKEKRVPVGTFRCPKCGYLESYARPEFECR